jgi:hypothetical protein
MAARLSSLILDGMVSRRLRYMLVENHPLELSSALALHMGGISPQVHGNRVSKDHMSHLID